MSTTMKTPTTTALAEQLAYLKLAFMLEQHGALAGEAARAQWDHLAYLAALVEGEAALRRERSVQCAAAHQAGALCGDQDPGAVPVELAEGDQSHAGPASVSPRLGC